MITLTGGGQLVLAGVRLDSLGPGSIGSAPVDVLTAAGPGSVLSGGRGDDTIIASQGQDTLSGGAGADVFVFETFGGGRHITDFEPGSDKLDLRGLARDQGYPGSGSSFDAYISFGSDGNGGAVIFTGVNIGADLIYLDHVPPPPFTMNNWIISYPGGALRRLPQRG